MSKIGQKWPKNEKMGEVPNFAPGLLWAVFDEVGGTREHDESHLSKGQNDWLTTSIYTT